MGDIIAVERGGDRDGRVPGVCVDMVRWWECHMRRSVVSNCVVTRRDSLSCLPIARDLSNGIRISRGAAVHE